MRVGLMPDSGRPSPEGPRRPTERVARLVEDEVAGVEVAEAMAVMVMVLGWRSR